MFRIGGKNDCFGSFYGSTSTPSDYSFAYVATWSQGKELAELKESLNIIRNAASELITKIDEKVQEITAEKAPVEQVKEFGHLKLSEPFKPEAMEADKPIMIVDARTKTPEKESVVKQLKKEKTKAAKPKKTKTASKKKEEVAI